MSKEEKKKTPSPTGTSNKEGRTELVVASSSKLAQLSDYLLAGVLQFLTISERLLSETTAPKFRSASRNVMITTPRSMFRPTVELPLFGYTDDWRMWLQLATLRVPYRITALDLSNLRTPLHLWAFGLFVLTQAKSLRRLNFQQDEFFSREKLNEVTVTAFNFATQMIGADGVQQVLKDYWKPYYVNRQTIIVEALQRCSSMTQFIWKDFGVISRAIHSSKFPVPLLQAPWTHLREFQVESILPIQELLRALAEHCPRLEVLRLVAENEGTWKDWILPEEFIRRFSSSLHTLVLYDNGEWKEDEDRADKDFFGPLSRMVALKKFGMRVDAGKQWDKMFAQLLVTPGIWPKLEMLVWDTPQLFGVRHPVFQALIKQESKNDLTLVFDHRPDVEEYRVGPLSDLSVTAALELVREPWQAMFRHRKLHLVAANTWKLWTLSAAELGANEPAFDDDAPAPRDSL